MGFKLGSAKREIRTPGKTPRFKTLREGVAGEANNDGTINIDPRIPEGSPEYNRIMKHEQQHVRDMESGRAGYGDSHVEWEGKIYFRREIDGEALIDGPAGRLPEGHPDHPWEAEAIAAEDRPMEEVDGSSVDRGYKMKGSPYTWAIGKFALGGLGGMAVRKAFPGDKNEEMTNEQKWSELGKEDKWQKVKKWGMAAALGPLSGIGKKFKR